MGREEARKLAQVLAALAASSDAADIKVAMLEAAASEIAKASGGTWQAAHMIAADGTHVFAGRLGEVIAITGDGGIFKGRQDGWRVSSKGIELDYAKLAKI
jgi:hypothetical protein